MDGDLLRTPLCAGERHSEEGMRRCGNVRDGGVVCWVDRAWLILKRARSGRRTVTCEIWECRFEKGTPRKRPEDK